MFGGGVAGVPTGAESALVPPPPRALSGPADLELCSQTRVLRGAPTHRLNDTCLQRRKAQHLTWTP